MPGRSARSTRPPGPWRTDVPPPRGNTLALVHGAFSSRIVATVAAELGPQLDAAIVKLAPWTAHERHALTRRNLIETVALKSLLLDSIADTVEAHGPQAVPTRRFETALSALRAEREALAALGLSPAGEAELRELVAGAASSEAELAEQIKAGRKAMLANPAWEEATS